MPPQNIPPPPSGSIVMGGIPPPPSGSIVTGSSPPDPPVDTRNAVQKGFDELTTVTPEQEEGHSPLVNRAQEFGAGVLSLGTPLIHPLKTLEATGNLLEHPMHTAYEIGHSASQQPFAQTLGQGAGASLLGAESEGLPKALTPYRSSVVSPMEANAEKLGQAILPQEGVTPNLVKSIQREAPHIREFAQRTGNPLRTVPEGLKAAEGVANEGLQNYRTNFLEPYAEEKVNLPNNMSPKLGGIASIGQIEKRISDINDLVRGATKGARSGGAEMTALERQGLEEEAGALRSKLYDELSQRTGVSPEDIQSMREGYGGQYSIKNALESGHYSRLTNTGRMSQGGGAGIYPSKAGLVDKLITTLRGGPEAIANRQFRSRIAKFEPQAPSYLTPHPPSETPFEPQSQILAPRPEYPRMTETPYEPLTPRERDVLHPFNGPLQKVTDIPSLREDYEGASSIRDEANRQYHASEAAKRAAEAGRMADNYATRGTRLQRLIK